ncbi:3-oxoacyl-ACP synthase [Burkholderia sp. MS389]|uniref:Beta-ketoacyl synthase chain length factor n=1 Tax=Burkholderia sola TaxID=2843302 RepID=A0ABV2CFP3_9BURK|nr:MULTISPECIES: beta-ketoacyl synthase chain length factor [unclassified Burkholderia]RQU69732.1 3-oxoacyl-ACP synthase [Burkholderia cenocepacia]MBP0609982.1 beta-ketoacyl synthase chain length factor [Burkholderia sp. CpTa8-5]OXI76903.1 3-oxoacyl-ACP synthase [Burkholderia sp. AU31280]QRR13912.1 3-oxoacyl-ACP synthase [Burkholderia sp. MS389]RQU93335.1 3-oxoacyl-ACP synthase [Burkholderia cenocepacia]
MADLHWTMPIARWTSISTAGVPGVEALDPMVRRRLSRLSRLALQVAYDCVGTENPVRVVFASRHGELVRTSGILAAIGAAEPVSPTAFSLSVLNAVTGIFGIARRDRSAATAVAAGHETLGYALLEAYSQYETSPASPVLLVYAHEPADPVYGDVDDDTESVGLAILLDAGEPAGHLVCEVAEDGPSEAGATGDAAGTQSAAVLRCLSARTTASWRGQHASWRWSWHDRAA